MRGFTTNAGTAPTEDLPSGRGKTVQLVNKGVGAAYVDVHINELNPQMGPGPYHYHSSSENIYYILEGVGKLVLESREITLGVGDVVFIPPGEGHSLTNIGTVALRLIEIYAPGGADFIRVEKKSPYSAPSPSSSD